MKWNKRIRQFLWDSKKREERIQGHMDNFMHYLEHYTIPINSGIAFRTGYFVALRTAYMLFKDTLNHPEEVEETIKRFVENFPERHNIG